MTCSNVPLFFTTIALSSIKNYKSKATCQISLNMFEYLNTHVKLLYKIYSTYVLLKGKCGKFSMPKKLHKTHRFLNWPSSSKLDLLNIVILPL